MKIGDHKHSRKVWFYHMGIGGKDQENYRGWKIRTLHTLFEEMKDTNVSIN